MEERLQKILSANGIASRRGAEKYLLDGRVTVNGKLASLGDKADPYKDTIKVDGETVGKKTKERTYLMLHKPRGYVTTLSDERGRKTASQLVAECGTRVWPVGRLDMDSEGLLIFTDDGDLTHKLTHPSHEVEKEYQVSVAGDLKRGVTLLGEPMVLDGEQMVASDVTLISQGEDNRGKITVTIHQGKNRQVRRMCAEVGLEVLRLKRIREGNLTLGKLPTGQWRLLTPEEVHWLKYL